MTEDAQRGEISALIADDDDQNARLLVRILERGGYGSIECTTESQKVLPLCEEHNPDLLLLDVSMPPPNGFEILEELAEMEGLNPVVVILTGHDHPSIEGKALELGRGGGGRQDRSHGRPPRSASTRCSTEARQAV